MYGLSCWFILCHQNCESSGVFLGAILCRQSHGVHRLYGRVFLCIDDSDVGYFLWFRSIFCCQSHGVHGLPAWLVLPHHHASICLYGRNFCSQHQTNSVHHVSKWPSVCCHGVVCFDAVWHRLLWTQRRRHSLQHALSGRLVLRGGWFVDCPVMRSRDLFAWYRVLGVLGLSRGLVLQCGGSQSNHAVCGGDICTHNGPLDLRHLSGWQSVRCVWIERGDGVQHGSVRLVWLVGMHQLPCRLVLCDQDGCARGMFERSVLGRLGHRVY